MHSWAHMTNGFSPSQPANSWQRFADEARNFLTPKRDHKRLKAHLLQDHRDLDELISVLACGPSIDDGLITRLKKRKLSLRDEIARVDAEIVSRQVRAPP
jgi:hypothetical protein